MTAIIISRNGGIRPLVRKQKPGLLGWISEQAVQACRHFFDQVDFDQTRNQIKHLPTSVLLHRRNEISAFRQCAQKEYGKKTWWLLLRYEVERYLRNARNELPAFQRLEKLLFATLVTMFASIAVLANTGPKDSRSFTLGELAAKASSVPMPISWLSEKAEAKGSRHAVMGAYSYATTAGYIFANDTSDRERMVAKGTLVELDGNYIELVSVSEPYVMPEVAQFVNRLGELHATRGCGKLVVTSALRTLEHQETLSNGSNYSVHPTGMSIDLRRPTDETSFCSIWLKDTLLEIEAAGRIDITAENAPRHYHIVVLPNEYASWLAKQPMGLDPEVRLLALALHFEGGPNESLEGYRAIAWVIRNRVRSSEFPNTIVEVVAEGAAGRSAGGCQFSFMCDGKAERIETPCAQSGKTMTPYQHGLCTERWNKVVTIARQVLMETEDPTGGAVLYYARSMRQAPYWAHTDMKKGTDEYFGNHRFACSVNRGDDACEV